MYGLMLCDWTTVRGSVTPVTQAESGWLDLQPYQDCVFWVDCREVTGSVTLSLQTAPTKDDAFFQSMVAGITLAASAQPTATAALLNTALVPLARWVRWQLSGSGTWDATLRIWVSANAPGGS